MPEGNKPQRARAFFLQRRRSIQLSGWMKNIGKQRWLRVSPVFFLGTVITAAATTVYKNDTAIFTGMIIMGMGVVAMWVAEIGKFNLKSLPGPLLFIAGSVLTSMSLTINPSNPLLCGGMILTGLGTVLMWLMSVGKWGLYAALVAALFTAGITLEAVSLTVISSDLMIMIGMIATGLGAFAMWAFELTTDGEEKED